MQKKKEVSEDFKALERELIGTQEMLAHVLKAVGEPVIVTKESIARGLGENTEIQVDDDLIRNCFVFSLSEQ